VTTARLLAIPGLLTSCAAGESDALRPWHLTSGQTVTAKYLWTDRQTLYLQDSQGKELTLPVGLLAHSELELVRGILAQHRQEGILYEAPCTSQSYHSRNVKSLDAERAGIYPLASEEKGSGTLELEFSRPGEVPAPGPGVTAVLRLTTASHRGAGTKSAVQVNHRGRLVGSLSGVKSAASFDIPLSPAVFEGAGSITLTVTCGNDSIHVRSGRAGRGPRLLLVSPKAD
jgi:hypothetical protein